MEYVPGGELFSHLREEGVFDAKKTGYIISNVVFIFPKLFLGSNIYMA